MQASGSADMCPPAQLCLPGQYSLVHSLLYADLTLKKVYKADAVCLVSARREIPGRCTVDQQDIGHRINR